MFALSRYISARTLHSSQVLGVPLTRNRFLVRTFYSATAQFTAVGAEGKVVTKDIDISIGDPEEAFVMIPTDIGHAFQAAHQASSDPSKPLRRPDRIPLNYFHDTKHFSLETSPDVPRLHIPQDLSPHSESGLSRATLYLYGLTHQVCLDGTPDARFAELASTIGPHIGGAIEGLKKR